MFIDGKEIPDEKIIKCLEELGYEVREKGQEMSYKRWKPGHFGHYYTLSLGGIFVPHTWTDSDFDRDAYDTDSIAPCSPEGEKYLQKAYEKKKAEVRLLDKLKELSNGKCGRFLHHQRNYSPYVDFTTGKICVCEYVTAQIAPARFYTQVKGVWEKIVEEMEADVKLVLEV